MTEEKKPIEVEKQLEEEEKDESYGDLFGKWARDKLRTSKRKIQDVE